MKTLARDHQQLASVWWRENVGEWIADDGGTTLAVGDEDVQIIDSLAPDHEDGCDGCGVLIKHARGGVVEISAGSVVRYEHEPDALPSGVGEPRRWCKACAPKA
jgi:hypothetical protein